MFGTQPGIGPGSFLGTMPATEPGLPSQPAAQDGLTEYMRQIMLYNHHVHQMRMLQQQHGSTFSSQGPPPAGTGLSACNVSRAPMPHFPPQPLATHPSTLGAPGLTMPSGAGGPHDAAMAPLLSQPSALVTMALHMAAGGMSQPSLAATAAAAHYLKSIQQQHLQQMPPALGTLPPLVKPTHSQPSCASASAPPEHSNVTQPAWLPDFNKLGSLGNVDVSGVRQFDLSASGDGTPAGAMAASLEPASVCVGGAASAAASAVERCGLGRRQSVLHSGDEFTAGVPGQRMSLPSDAGSGDLASGCPDLDGLDDTVSSLQGSEEEETTDVDDDAPMQGPVVSQMGSAQPRAVVPPPCRVGRPRGQASSFSTDPVEREAKKQRRKQSNRDSARRSRLRKQAEMHDVADGVDRLAADNTGLFNKVAAMNTTADRLDAENAVLRELLALTRATLEATGKPPLPSKVDAFRVKLQQLTKAADMQEAAIAADVDPGADGVAAAAFSSPKRKRKTPTDKATPFATHTAARVATTTSRSVAKPHGDVDMPLRRRTCEASPNAVLPSSRLGEESMIASQKAFGLQTEETAAASIGRQNALTAAASAQAQARTKRSYARNDTSACDDGLDAEGSSDDDDGYPSPKSSNALMGGYETTTRDAQVLLATHANARRRVDVSMEDDDMDMLLNSTQPPRSAPQGHGQPGSPIMEHLLVPQRPSECVLGISGRFSMKVQAANSGISLSRQGSGDSDMMSPGKSYVGSSGLADMSRHGTSGDGAIGALSSAFGADATVAGSVLIEQDTARSPPKSKAAVVARRPEAAAAVTWPTSPAGADDGRALQMSWALVSGVDGGSGEDVQGIQAKQETVTDKLKQQQACQGLDGFAWRSAYQSSDAS